MGIDIKLTALSPVSAAALASLVDDYFERGVGLDGHLSYENDAKPGEFVGFKGAVSLLTHLEWEGYEYGYKRIASFDDLVALSAVGLAKLLSCELGTVSVGGRDSIAIIAENVSGRPFPLMLNEHCISCLASGSEDDLDAWYVNALTRAPVDWGPETFPALGDLPWQDAYYGVQVPHPVQREWLAANQRCRGPTGDGTGVVRCLGLSAPFSIIGQDWDRLLAELESLPRGFAP